MRMTKAKRAVLVALQELGEDFREWDTPPYNVALIAQHLGADLSNTAKTLQRLEQSGHVVRELRPVAVWNAIKRDTESRQCVCYWVASTMEQDKARVQAWEDGRAERAAAALDKLARMAQQAYAQQSAPRLAPPAPDTLIIDI